RPRRALPAQRPAGRAQRRDVSWLGLQTLAHELDDALARDVLACLLGARAVFDVAVFQAALAHDEAMRNAPKLGILEHDAGSQAAVVEHHLEAGFLEFVMQSGGGAENVG